MNSYESIEQLKHELKSEQTLKDLFEIEMMIKNAPLKILEKLENILREERKKQVNQFLLIDEENLDNLNMILDLIQKEKVNKNEF